MSSTSNTPASAKRGFRESLLAMLGIGFVNMLVAFDQTIVSTSLPSIVAELKDFHLYAWIASAYMLASVVAVPVFGRLGDYFGRKTFVIAAIVIFTTASMLCGAASSMTALLMWRALQGIGGGMMVGTAFACIPDLFPEARTRVRWQVVMSASYGIGTAAGPFLGGFISQYYSWRYTFYINLPVGLLSLYCVGRYLPLIRHHQQQTDIRLDWAGAGLIAAFLACLQLSFERLPQSGLSTANLALLLATPVLLLLALGVERRASHPIMPLALFRNRGLVVLFCLSMITGLIMYSLIFFIPMLLQAGFGISPHDAGLLATPLAASIAIGSFVNTRVIGRLNKPSKTLTFGLLLLLIASAIIIMTQRNTPLWKLELAMFAAGVGLGFMLNNMNIFSQELAGRENFGIATALMQSTRMIGGMLGTGLLGSSINQFYAAKSESLLRSTFPADCAARLIADYRSPESLVSHAGSALISLPGCLGSVQGAPLLDSLRELLVASIHQGMGIIVLCALIALMLERKISYLRLKR